MHFTDQVGHTFHLAKTPQRIVSLVPSQTEFLCDLGLEHRLVGITKYCIHPYDKVNQIVKVGGTKNFSINKIDALQPDLIIANKEENTKEGIEFLKMHYPVYTSDITTIEDAYNMMHEIGTIVNKGEEAKKMIVTIEDEFSILKGLTTKSVKTLYLIWRKPWMTIGGDTFISHMMQIAGFDNCCTHLARYPVLTEEEIQRINPAVVLLSSEPYPFKSRHLKEIQAICPHADVKLVDGELFSWYGSRMGLAPTYFLNLLKK